MLGVTHSKGGFQNGSPIILQFIKGELCMVLNTCRMESGGCEMNKEQLAKELMVKWF